MSKKAKLAKQLEDLKFLVQKKSELLEKKNKIASDLFKYETLYLEITQGFPLTKVSDYYVTNKLEKKKYLINDKDRIFSLEYPK